MRMYVPALLAILLLLLCGCPPKTNKAANTGTTVANTASLGGTVRLPLDISLDDPSMQALDFTQQRLWALARAIGLPLMKPDFAQQSAVPGLASSAQMLDEGSQWNFSLPPAPGHTDDPQWLAGEVKSMFRRIVNADKSALRAEIMDLIEGADEFANGAPDISGISVADNQVSFSLTRPYSQFDLWLSQPGLAYAAVTLSQDAAGNATFSSSGFAAWKIGRLTADPDSGLTTLELLPNPDSLVGQPAADELMFVLEPDRGRQVELFKSGQLDAANVPVTMVPQIESDAQLSPMLQKHDTAVSLLVMFDQGQDPWGDQVMQDKVGLRQSLGLSISRESLEEENNFQVHGWGHFLPDCFRNAIPQNLLNDPIYPRSVQLEEARLKQKESDHEQGTHLPLNMDVAFNNFDYLNDLDRDLLQFWSDISIKLQPFPLSHAELLKRIDLNSHEVIVFWNYPAWPSPEACLYPQLYGKLIGNGGNYSRIDDPVINRTLEQAQQESNSGLRNLHYQKLGEIIEERGLFVPAAYASPSLLLRPGLAVSPGPFDFNASLQAQDFSSIGFEQ